MVHITNCIAIASLDDTMLYKEFMNIVDPDRDYKPYIGHLCILGYKAYVLIPPEDRLRSRKLDPCTEIGILVGYKGEYIYWIQVPGSGLRRQPLLGLLRKKKSSLIQTIQTILSLILNPNLNLSYNQLRRRVLEKYRNRSLSFSAIHDPEQPRQPNWLSLMKWLNHPFI